MNKIRLATLNDARAILEIYCPYILESVISFEYEAPSLEEIQRRISEVQEKFPWIVFEDQGQILGYAYAGTFRTRVAYQWSVESAVYIRQGHHGKGIGKKLYGYLFQLLKDQGVANVIGGISLPNEASVKLHESLGFSKVAHLKDIGFKFGQWWDVGYWQLQLQKPEKPDLLKPAK